MIFKTVFLVGVALLSSACSTNVPDKPKEQKVSDLTPACRATKLAPLMACGGYVIVKGRINTSNNLERANETTMYMSGVENVDSNTLVNKNVLLSGKCASEVITGPPTPTGVSGGFFTMIYLNEVKLLQPLDNKKIDKARIKQICNSLKDK